MQIDRLDGCGDYPARGGSGWQATTHICKVNKEPPNEIIIQFRKRKSLDSTELATSKAISPIKL